MPESLDAVVFDFDGLILDTESPEIEAWKAEFSRHGLEMDPLWWRQITGMGADLVHTKPEQILERELGRTLDPVEVLTRVNRQRLEGIFANPILPGVVELLSELNREGILVGIASSSKHAWVDGHLDRLGLSELFPIVCCADDVERAKPYPDLYLLACSRLGAAPEKSVALEDSENGIASAKAAGLRVIACPNPATIDFDLSRADLHVDSLLELDVAKLRALP